MQAAEADLDAIERRVARGALRGAANIGMRVGEVVNRRKVKKHFECRIGDDSFSHRRRAESVRREPALDGVYVIRTSPAAEDMAAEDCVRSCKALTRVERAFRTMKTADLHVRPIHHRTADRVRAHIFLCMLAYYVEWHMREAWRDILFSDPELAASWRMRDPVAPAQRSGAARRKAATRRLPDGTPAYSFRTLIEDLGTVVRNTCRARAASAKGAAATFEMTTLAEPEQERALSLIGEIGANPAANEAM
ncbi:MAG: transposase [Albidovulum sp.]|nr:transposase [Albidovulum sp.]